MFFERRIFTKMYFFNDILKGIDMNQKKIIIADNIQYLRKYSKMSIEDLAEKLGVSRQTISKWENGKSYSDILNSAKLQDCLI